MKKIIPNKIAIEDSYELFEMFIRDINNQYRPFTAMRFLMCLMDGPKDREEVAAFIDETSPTYKNKGQRTLRSNTHTLSNISRIAKKLHRGGMIRIIYTHPKHDTPCTDTGKLRLGATATYLLTETSSQFIRGWIYRCFMSLGGPFYESESPQDGELVLDDAELGEYYITTIDKSGLTKIKFNSK